MLLYFVASKIVVSAALMQEEGQAQYPVYYMSRLLLDIETRYLTLEKLVLALVTTSRKLKPYLKAHLIKVLSNYSIKSVLARPELSGRMIKGAVERGGYGLIVEPQTKIKSQGLADFMVEFSVDLQIKMEKNVHHLDLEGGSNKP